MKSIENSTMGRGFPRRQRGGVAIMFGLTLVVLIGFIGLSIDLGRFFVIKSELQNAMDACALSAASQLKPGAGDPNALTNRWLTAGSSSPVASTTRPRAARRGITRPSRTW